MRKLLLTFLMLPWLAHAQAINAPPTITTFGQLQGSTGTAITGFGVAIGQALGPLVNVGGSGHPGFNITDRLVLQQTLPAAPTDFAVLQILRTTNFSTGSSSNISRALVVTTTVGANDPTNEWNIGGTCTSVSTVGANCIGGNFQGFRTAGNAAVWGALVEARDATDQTSNAGKGVVGMELDFGANLADNAANGAIIGHAGVRIGLDMVLYRYNGVDTAQTQGAVGLWFTTSTFSGGAGDTHTNYGSMIGAAVNTQAYSVLDARGTIAPTGSVNPVYGVNMDAGQAIEFKGDDTTLSPAPQRTLLYTGSALSYQVSAVTKFSISDTGGVTAVGLPATAGSSGLYVCVDSVGVLYKKSACP